MIAILADDLSGALDTAVVFQLRGASTVVRPDSHTDNPLSQDTIDVVAWNINDRHAHATDARARVVDCLSGTERLYMKIDSTLRGPVGAQIDAVMEGTSRYRSALVCPAFPENGRTVVRGHLYVHGRPLEQTALAQDPENPMGSGNIVEILRRTSRRTVKALPFDQLSLVEHPVGIYVVDAQTSDDLDRLARYLTAHPEVLPVGSAGLARALGEIWISGRTVPNPHDSLGPVDQILALVGSLHPTTREQVIRAQTGGSWEVWKPVIGSAPVEIHPNARAVMLTTPIDRIQGASGVLDAMVHVAASQVQRELGHGRRLAVIATGGDTALGFLRHLSVAALRPKSELAPGVVLSVADIEGQPLLFITKSGAFGGPDFFDWVHHRFARHCSERRSVTS